MPGLRDLQPGKGNEMYALELWHAAGVHDVQGTVQWATPDDRGVVLFLSLRQSAGRSKTCRQRRDTTSRDRNGVGTACKDVSGPMEMRGLQPLQPCRRNEMPALPHGSQLHDVPRSVPATPHSRWAVLAMRDHQQPRARHVPSPAGYGSGCAEDDLKGLVGWKESVLQNVGVQLLPLREPPV